jgi:hypothetical protein
MILLIAIILFIILVLCQVRKKDKREGYGYTVNDYSIQWTNKAGVENSVQKWIFVFVNNKGQKYKTKVFEKGIAPDTMFTNFTLVDNTKLIDNETFDVNINGINKLKVYYNEEKQDNFITEKEFEYGSFGTSLSDVEFTVPPPEKAYYSWKYYKKQILGISQLKDLVPDNSGTIETLGPWYSYQPLQSFFYDPSFDGNSEGTMYFEGHFYANQTKELINFPIRFYAIYGDFMKFYIDGKLQFTIDSDSPSNVDNLNYTFIKGQTHKIQIVLTSEVSSNLGFQTKPLSSFLEDETNFTKKKFNYSDTVNIPEDAFGEIFEPEIEIDRTGEFVWQLFDEDGYLTFVGSFLDLKPTKTGLTKSIKNKHDGTGGTLANNNYKSYYGVKWTGYFVPKKNGSHGFMTRSDDMSYLYIDGTKLVDNGGLHGMVTKWRNISLTKNETYKIEIYFSERTGGDEMKVWFREPYGSWKNTFDGYLSPFDYEPLLTLPPPTPTYDSITVYVDEETKKVTVTLYGITNPDPYYTLKIGDKVEYQFTANDAGTTLEFEWYETSYGYKYYGLYMNTENITSVNFEVKPPPISYKILTSVKDGTVTLKLIDIVNADPYYKIKIGDPNIVNYQFETGDTEKTFTWDQAPNITKNYNVYLNYNYEQAVIISTHANLSWRYFEVNKSNLDYEQETDSGTCNNISSLEESIGIEAPNRNFGVLWEGAFVPETDGEYEFKAGTNSGGTVKITLNGKQVIYKRNYSGIFSEKTDTIVLKAGISYFFRVYYSHYSMFADDSKGEIIVSYKKPGSDEFTSDFSSITQFPTYLPLVKYEVYRTDKDLPQGYNVNIPENYLVKAGTTSNLGSKNDIIGDFFDEATTGRHLVKIVITYTPQGDGDKHYWRFSSTNKGNDYNSFFYDEAFEKSEFSSGSYDFYNTKYIDRSYDNGMIRGREYEFKYWVRLDEWDDDFNIRVSRTLGGDDLYYSYDKPLERVNYIVGANTEIEQAKNYTPTCKPWHRSFDDNPFNNNAYYKDFLEKWNYSYDDTKWYQDTSSWSSKCSSLNNDKKACREKDDGSYFNGSYQEYKTCQWR